MINNSSSNRYQMSIRVIDTRYSTSRLSVKVFKSKRKLIMFTSFKLQFLISFILVHLINCSLNVAIEEQDKLRFKSLFNVYQKIDATTLPDLYYSLVGLNVLHNSNLNNVFTLQQKDEFCDQMRSFISPRSSLENLFFASSSLKLLNCQFDKSQLSTLVEPMINNEVTVPVLFKASVCLESADKVMQSSRIAKLLNGALSKDKTLLSTGLALQLASKLSRTDQTLFSNSMPGVIAKADEVDAQYLQYEGGLGVTVQVFKGILDLSTAANKTTGLTDLQVIKFVNYFMKRLTVQTTKGAAELIQILKRLSDNKHHIPVIVSLYGSNVVNEQSSSIVVKVTNTLGQSLAREFSVTGKLNGMSELLKFSQVSGDSTLYAADLLPEPKRPAGKYTLKLSTLPVKADKRLVISRQEIDVIVQSRVQLDSIEIGIGEKDQLAIRHEPVEYPISLKNVLECDNSQKISIKFCVRDLVQSKDLTVQQSLIYFVNDKTGETTVFVADQDRLSKVYNRDVNLAYKGRDFNYQSGDYSIRLVVGDSTLEKSINWMLGKVNIQFNNQEPIEISDWLAYYKARPEIVHQFKQPEQRPPVLVSHTFTVLCLSPILVMIVCWFKIGLNLSKFSFTLSALLFHVCMFMIFTLYTLFFIKLDMFQTMKCLSGVFLTAFLSGYFHLKSLASK